jgi:hypothetical protein
MEPLTFHDFQNLLVFDICVVMSGVFFYAIISSILRSRR